jgi:hypothetical protein
VEPWESKNKCRALEGRHNFLCRSAFGYAPAFGRVVLGISCPLPTALPPRRGFAHAGVALPWATLLSRLRRSDLREGSQFVMSGLQLRSMQKNRSSSLSRKLLPDQGSRLDSDMVTV